MSTRYALAAFVVAFAVAGAGIYKWVDEKGATHYSDSPPPRTKSEKIHVPPPSPTVPLDAEQSRQSLEQQEREFRQRRVEEDEQYNARQAEAKQREATCARAQRNLKFFKIDRPIYRIDKYGERVYIEDKDRDAVIAKATREIEDNCKR